MGEFRLVAGALEYVQSVVAQCRREYEEANARQPLTGLLEPMRAAFGLAERPQRLAAARREPTSSSSAAIGALVHRQLELAAAGRDVVAPHPLTQAIADFIRARGWAVVAAEVPLLAGAAPLFTRIDLLLYDVARNETLLAEVKTGRDAGYRARLVSERAHLGLVSARQDVHDSQHARAHLQLAWMYWALQRHYAVPRLRPIVLVANARGVRAEPLVRWAHTARREIYARVCAEAVRIDARTDGRSISPAPTHTETAR